MSAHYYDAGSGPHDTLSRADGLYNCGCRHDGVRWLHMCSAARASFDEVRRLLNEAKRAAAP